MANELYCSYRIIAIIELEFIHKTGIMQAQQKAILVDFVMH